MAAPGARTTASTPSGAPLLSRGRRTGSFYLGRTLTYSALLLWAFICLFPIYWTAVTSLKNLRLITTGPLNQWCRPSS